MVKLRKPRRVSVVQSPMSRCKTTTKHSVTRLDCPRTPQRRLFSWTVTRSLTIGLYLTRTSSPCLTNSSSRIRRLDLAASIRQVARIITRARWDRTPRANSLVRRLRISQGRTRSLIYLLHTSKACTSSSTRQHSTKNRSFVSSAQMQLITRLWRSP